LLFGITQFLIRGPHASDLASGFAITAVTFLLCLAGIAMGVAAFRGHRFGLWMSLIAFILFSVGNGWSLSWAIAISREISDVSVYSFQSFLTNTVDGRIAFIRNCVIGYALSGLTWSLAGVVLQAHALVSRAAEKR
jgi:hypothetical protein